MSDSNYSLNILAISPHPDDAELFCGGFLLSAKMRGETTGIIDLTKGELSSQGSVEKRAVEAEAASAVLQLDIRENAGLPDGLLGRTSEQFSSKMQLQKIVHIIRRLQPEIILAPYWQGRHPDHVAASKLVTDAAFFSGVRKFLTGSSDSPFTPRQICYYQMRYEFRPSFIVDISEVAEEKYQAVECFESQIKRSGSSDSESLQTLVSSPLTLPALEARDKHYGAMIGAPYGEPYLVKNILSIKDPLGYFRNNPTAESLQFPTET